MRNENGERRKLHKSYYDRMKLVVVKGSDLGRKGGDSEQGQGERRRKTVIY